MALTNGIVIKVMRWGYLHNASTKREVNVIVSDDGDGAVTQRQAHRLTNQMAIALIIWVDHHCNVTQEGFWTSRCYHEGA